MSYRYDLKNVEPATVRVRYQAPRQTGVPIGTLFLIGVSLALGLLALVAQSATDTGLFVECGVNISC